MIRRRDRARYGIDGGMTALRIYAPILGGLLTLLVWAKRHEHRRLTKFLSLAILAVAGSETSYLYSTGPGKRSLWSDLLADLALRGDEKVLDVGCGRGAVLMLAAHLLPSGRAVGADIWRRRDQSGNSRSAAERNSRCEGVQDRVELVDADARDLPFPSESFDVVVSNITFHNIAEPDGRAQALREAVRVLRPGGRLRIVDHNASRYLQVLREAGCEDLELRTLDWRTWFGLPGHHLDLISATKRGA